MIPNVAYYDAETQTFAFDGFKYKLDQIDGKTSKTQVSFVERKRYFWSDFHLWTANGPKIKMAPAKAAEIKSDIVVALYGWPVIAEKIFDGYFTISIVPRKYVVLNIKTGQVYLTADEKKLL